MAETLLNRIIQNSASHDSTEQDGLQQAVGGTGAHRSPERPYLLLMGLRRSGKSSISSVIFHKLPPNETLYLETTKHITKDSLHSFMDFQIIDFPAQVDFGSLADYENMFKNVGALLWVIDAQDEYFDTIEKLIKTIIYLQHRYPNINIEVFVHKVDGLSEDFRSDIYRDIQQRIMDDLGDHRLENAPVSFYLTSIYDHSIFEAFSKVIQKLVRQLPALENMLNSLCSKTRIRKAYLFDVLSKIYIASDTSPSDISMYETCSDFIDVVVDVGEIYGWDRPQVEGALDGAGKEHNNDETESMITMERPGVGFLYLREVNKYLALVCIMGGQDPNGKKALIDYNIRVFQEALNEVFSI